MSDRLYQLLRTRYPETEDQKPRLSVYPPHENEDEENPTYIERIHLQVLQRKLQDETKKLTSEEIEGLAKIVFDDVEFRFFPETDEGDMVFFEPRGIKRYPASYSNHYIGVEKDRGNGTPWITISTGNRGEMTLHDRQREKYFRFVTELYEIYWKKNDFLENCPDHLSGNADGLK